MPKTPLIDALNGIVSARPPIWLMRQAGRYLPEYRELRGQAGSFVDLCLTPALAAEVTLQPIRRYGFDAAILFSDILMVPFGLGQHLRFEEGRGPILAPIQTAADIPRFDPEGFHAQLGPIYETVERVRAELDPSVALIGFAGSPWTVASYMVEGGTSRDFARLKTWAFADPDGFDRLIARIAEATIAYLDRQIRAGAQVVKLFDSWAGAAPETVFERAVIAPTKSIVTALKRDHPSVPIIGFARGAGAMTRSYVETTGIDAVALDSATPLAMACALQADRPVQGNLDPMALVAGGDALRAETDRIVDALSAGPFVFNLGHGIVPQTPPEHVAELVARLRG
ncbi:MAG: uroporphyrinogen decarboxylase [Alphaproteobacteria bacterium]|nr:uroporphyrinogen decarboxylase [Alphaproteobacteria bacterium]